MAPRFPVWEPSLTQTETLGKETGLEKGGKDGCFHFQNIFEKTVRYSGRTALETPWRNTEEAQMRCPGRNAILEHKANIKEMAEFRVEGIDSIAKELTFCTEGCQRYRRKSKRILKWMWESSEEQEINQKTQQGAMKPEKTEFQDVGC